MEEKGRLSYVWGESKKRGLSKIDFYGGATSSLLVSGDGNIYPMIGYYQKLGNIKTDSIKEVFYNHPLLKKIRGIKVADFAECCKCRAVDFCTFCPSAHLSSNNYELMKLDKKTYDFTRLKKKFAQKRNTILKE